MHDTLTFLKKTDFPPIHRTRLSTLQVNLGYLCNQSCLHCHVNAGPTRTELMTRETIDHVLAYLDASTADTLDLTGGAPEMNSHFRDMVREARELGAHVIDRCNLTILLEPGFEDMAEFLAEQQVSIVASLPCYIEENVDKQRGKGVYDKSIIALQKLNALGYGRTGSGLNLNLVFNPQGPSLPPPQAPLQNDYKQMLSEQFDIEFNELFTLCNMPIQRFGSTLISKGQFEEYMTLLRGAYHEENLDGVMCRSLVSVDWQGYVYDCDFNQMLGIGMPTSKMPRLHIRELTRQSLIGQDIAIADHCYGCTAGQGSSCGGALN